MCRSAAFCANSVFAPEPERSSTSGKLVSSFIALFLSTFAVPASDAAVAESAPDELAFDPSGDVSDWFTEESPMPASDDASSVDALEVVDEAAVPD